MSYLKQLFRDNGHLTESDLDFVGIVRVALKSEKPKDQRVMLQQMAVIMNSHDMVKYYQKYEAAQVLNEAMRAVKS